MTKPNCEVWIIHHGKIRLAKLSGTHRTGYNLPVRYEVFLNHALYPAAVSVKEYFLCEEEAKLYKALLIAFEEIG